MVDARAKLETAQSELEAARESYGEARRALEVLLGRYPAAEIEVAAAYPPLPPPVGAGMPASLLERRPDIVAAERGVLAAFRQEEAARARTAAGFLDLAGRRAPGRSAALATAAQSVACLRRDRRVIPIYEGGALRAQVKIATAQQAQAVAHYGASC